MDVFGVVTDVFRDVRQERDDVVVRDGLNLVDAVYVEFCFGADVDGSFFRDFTEFGHGVAGSHFYVQDGLPFVLDRPEMTHFRVGVTCDHSCIFPLNKPTAFFRRGSENTTKNCAGNQRFPCLSYHFRALTVNARRTGLTVNRGSRDCG